MLKNFPSAYTFNKNDNVASQGSQRKQGDPVHGNIYQLKLLMLFLYRGVSQQYSFRLGTEIKEAKKFDDLVFEYTNKSDKKEYRLLQAKHRLDESKKITTDDLLTESDGDYSLVKYFFSYQDVKKEKLFKDGIIKDVIICTNIDLDFESLQKKQIDVEKLKECDRILDVNSQFDKEPIRYRFNEKIISLLKPKLQNYDLTRLARRLAECLLKNNSIKDHDKNDIFHFYHGVLAEEVIDAKAKKFHDEFIENGSVSEITRRFREIFKNEIEKQSEGKVKLENINEAITSKKIVINNKPMGLNLSKNFGRGEDKAWPSNVISDDEVKDFLNHLVFAVNQPNEEELGKIVKQEIGKGFDFITTEHVYNKFFIRMLNWLQGKEGDRFLSYEDGKEFFEEVNRGVSIFFGVREPVESFTGRIEQLKELHAILQDKGQMVVSQIASISGLGGVGKSELARKYVNEYSHDYDNRVIWINAENYETLTESFLRLAQDTLGINRKNRDEKEKDIKSIVEDVYQFFSKGKSLFIFDNAEKRKTQHHNDDAIDKFLPSHINKPYVLITSRNQQWGNIPKLELGIFTEKEAAEFIRKSLGLEARTQKNEVAKLGEILQRFPLALQQAVAYIRSMDVTLKNVGSQFEVSDYLRRYEEEAEKLLDFNFPEDSSDSYTKTTFTTWKITTDKIKSNPEHGKQAEEILSMVAYFDSDNIPAEIFLNGVDSNKEKLGSAIQLLKQYSIVNSGHEQRLLNIHCLVQQVTRINSKEQNKEEAILKKSLKLFLLGNINASHINHAVSIWGHASKYNALVKEFSDIPYDIVMALYKDIRYEEASSFGIKALELLKNSQGRRHHSTLNIMRSIADVLEKQGKYEKALALYQEALEPKNPEFAGILNNIAFVLARQGKYDKSLKTYQELKNILAPDDPLSLGVQNNVAWILEAQGNDDEALKIYKDVLKKQEELLEKNDQFTLVTRKNIAKLLVMKGKHDESLKTFREIYQIMKGTLGENHPDTLTVQADIAFCLQIQGRVKEALETHEDVLKKRNLILGESHPDTLVTRNNMALMLNTRGRPGEALDLYNDVLIKQEQSLGQDHPTTILTQHNIAATLRELGQYDKSLKLFKDVFKEREKKFGVDHPDALLTQYNLAWTLHIQGQYDEALKLYQEVYEKRKKLLGESHADTVITLSRIEMTNLQKNTKWTRLHLAAGEGYIEAVKRLLERGADINDQTTKGSTALHIVAENGHEKIAKVLLETKDIAVNVQTFDKGWTPLHYATLNGHHKIISILIGYEAEVNAKTSDKYYTPLHYAAQNGHNKSASILISNGAEVNALAEGNVVPLHLAAQNGHQDAVDLLLKDGAQANVKTRQGYTPLYLAALYGHEKVVKVLLNSGAMYDNSGDFDKMLSKASKNEVIINIFTLIKELFEAVKQNNPLAVENLTRKEIFVNAKDSEGRTLLHYAANNGNRDIIDILLKYRADAAQVTSKGNTVLHLATLNNQKEMVEVILKHVKRTSQGKFNNFINIQTTVKGATSLHVAAQRGYVDIASILVNFGASINMLDKENKTPLDYALEKQHSEVTEFLKGKAAKTADELLLGNSLAEEARLDLPRMRI